TASAPLWLGWAAGIAAWPPMVRGILAAHLLAWVLDRSDTRLGPASLRFLPGFEIRGREPHPRQPGPGVARTGATSRRLIVILSPPGPTRPWSRQRMGHHFHRRERRRAPGRHHARALLGAPATAHSADRPTLMRRRQPSSFAAQPLLV